jgi:hypothetical protein
MSENKNKPKRDYMLSASEGMTGIPAPDAAPSSPSIELEGEHIHVNLPSGATATVSPDASPELLSALDKMAELAMKMPEDNTSVAIQEEPLPMYLEFDSGDEWMEIICPDEDGDFCVALTNRKTGEEKCFFFLPEEAERVAIFLHKHSEIANEEADSWPGPELVEEVENIKILHLEKELSAANAQIEALKKETPKVIELEYSLSNFYAYKDGCVRLAYALGQARVQIEALQKEKAELQEWHDSHI